VSGAVWSIVLAAGRGSRFAGAKQFAQAGGMRLVDRVVMTAGDACDAVVVVLPPGVGWDGPQVTATVPGGVSRAASVRAGLLAVPDHAEVIVVHDAAHPVAPVELFDRVIEGVRAGADAVVPVLPVNEVLRRVEQGRMVEDIPREGVVLAQTPQGFRAAALRRVHRDNPEAVEDSALVAAAGGVVAVVEGDPVNIHVTTRAELTMAARLLECG
jgi:2-C-methyl-D-erythritol 4-phosphate cytidylyltransferase